MVLYNASNRARNSTKTINRTNTCGGNKKCGTPSYGWMTGHARNANLYRVNTTTPQVIFACPMIGSDIVRQQRNRGYASTLGPN